MWMDGIQYNIYVCDATQLYSSLFSMSLSMPAEKAAIETQPKHRVGRPPVTIVEPATHPATIVLYMSCFARYCVCAGAGADGIEDKQARGGKCQV